MRGQPEYYRGLAKRSRKLAAEKDEDAKSHLLDVARQCEKLADEAETTE